MRPIAQVARRPVVVVWIMALFAGVFAFLVCGSAWPARETVAGAIVIAVLLGLGDVAAVKLEDRSVLAPAPALLIAGLALAGWPLLPLAAILGTLLPAVIRRRARRRALLDAGARCLVVALVAPIYLLTTPPGTLPYSTPPALLGLLLIGLVAYTIELVFGADGDRHGSLLARSRARLGALRWYVPAMIPLGALLGALWSVSPWVFLLGLAPLIVAQRSFWNEIALRQATRDFSELAQQQERLATRLERLQALATSVIGTLNVQTMLEILCERLAALMEAPYGWVVLLDEGGRPRLMAGHNLPPGAERERLANAQGYLALLERGRVMLVTHEHCEALVPAPLANAQLTSMLSIPLMSEKRVLGTICLAFDRLRGLDIDEQRVLTSFARQAAMALENARLFDEVRRKQAELIQSSKLAAVGTFAAGIAHEFNNLLASMLGNAELGFALDDSEEKNRSLDIVIQACKRGRSITRGLLTFARRQEHDRVCGNIADAIDETLTLVELDLRKSKIDVIRQIEPVPATVCDLGQISQVVLNLITNARDAMQPQGGTLTIGLCEQDGTIELSVADTGCGIPEELRDKIFEPFVTTKGALGGSQIPGTGLGLSVSYGIVQEHGGAIHVESTAGSGTTMRVCLPIVLEDVEHARAVGQS